MASGPPAIAAQRSRLFSIEAQHIGGDPIMLAQTSSASVLHLAVVAAAALLLIAMAFVGAGHLGEKSRFRA